MVSYVVIGQGIKADHIYNIDRGHSYIGFAVKYMGYAKVRGRFSTFQGHIVYDENNVTNTSVAVSINARSIDTESDFRDRDLRSDQWLDAENFPEISFVSKAVSKSADGITVTGDFTLRGVTKEIALVMDNPSGVLPDVRGDSQVIFTGGVTIDRTEYGVEGKRWSRIKEGIAGVDSKVEIELTILGKRINENNFRNWVRDENRPHGSVYKVASEKGVKAALKTFEEIKSDTARKVNFNTLNIVGNMLLKEGKTKDAIAVFEANAEVFENRPAIYNALGEAYLALGKKDKAAEYYRLSLASDPEDLLAPLVLRYLE